MAHMPHFNRPTFDDALNAWKKILDQRQFPTELVWVYDDNLCFEKDPAATDGFRIGFQTQITPPPRDADRVTFEYFCEFPARLVFYRIGSSGGRSVCLMLCDEWFESKGETDGYIRRDDWFLSFHPGAATEIEEVTDPERWRQRAVRDRPLHDLDFCMTLRGIHEILAHGRVLTSYEHFALRFLHAWTRFMGERH